MADYPEDLRQWFRTWGAWVAAVDFQSARPLFSQDVVGFGTHATFVVGIDALQQEQWEKIWPNIAEFRFLVDDLVGSVDGDAAWAAVPWSSVGYDEHGAPFDRPGRATVTFRRVSGRWLGTHTHFSLNPGVPQMTFGPRPGIAG